MMKLTCLLTILFLILQTCFAPPVTQNVKKEKEEQHEAEVGGLEDYMEYHRYLKEIVNALESDPDFRSKLEKANEEEIRSGKIADQLEFVSHHVRTRLDEIKRLELQRLKELTEKKMKLENNINSIDEDPLHNHLDRSNPHTFEIEDLKKLIAKTTEDLAEADRKRKEEFKNYELEKEFQKQEKLNHTNGAEREKLEKEYKEMEEKHKKHEKLHEPGHKAQLEEVWEEQDQMQQDFDPKTFFMLHDIDGNGLWDQEEVKALFIKELDKMYQQGAPEDDMRERVEEMERMRESVFAEMDKNRDGFIDFHEFLQQTNSNDFKQDHGWQALDEQKPYTDEELQNYVRQHHEPQHYYQPGMPQAPPGGYQHVPPGAYQQVPPGGYQQIPPEGYHPNAIPPGAQFHPGQVPQSPPQPLPGSQGYLNTNEIHPNQQYHQPNYQQQQQQYQPPPPGSYQQYQGQSPQYHQPQGGQTQQQYQHPEAPSQQQQQLPPQPQQAHSQQNQPPQDQSQPQQQVPQQVPQQPQQVPQQPQQIPQQPQQIPQQPQQVPQQQQQQKQQEQLQQQQQAQQYQQAPPQTQQVPQQPNQVPQQVPN